MQLTELKVWNRRYKNLWEKPNKSKNWKKWLLIRISWSICTLDWFALVQFRNKASTQVGNTINAVTFVEFIFRRFRMRRLWEPTRKEWKKYNNLKNNDRKICLNCNRNWIIANKCHSVWLLFSDYVQCENIFLSLFSKIKSNSLVRKPWSNRIHIPFLACTRTCDSIEMTEKQFSGGLWKLKIRHSLQLTLPFCRWNNGWNVFDSLIVHIKRLSISSFPFDVLFALSAIDVALRYFAWYNLKRSRSMHVKQAMSHKKKKQTP